VLDFPIAVTGTQRTSPRAQLTQPALASADTFQVAAAHLTGADGRATPRRPAARFMPNGSLYDLLHGRREALVFSQRLSMSSQARGASQPERVNGGLPPPPPPPPPPPLVLVINSSAW